MANIQHIARRIFRHVDEEHLPAGYALAMGALIDAYDEDPDFHEWVDDVQGSAVEVLMAAWCARAPGIIGNGCGKPYGKHPGRTWHDTLSRWATQSAKTRYGYGQSGEDPASRKPVRRRRREHGCSAGVGLGRRHVWGGSDSGVDSKKGGKSMISVTAHQELGTLPQPAQYRLHKITVRIPAACQGWQHCGTKGRWSIEEFLR